MFFKDLHLRLSSVKPIIFDSFFCNNKLQEIQTKLTTTRNSKLTNGYWKSDYNDCIIYIQDGEKNKDIWLEGVVVEATNKNVKPGSIKFYISRNKVDKYYTTNYITPKGIMTSIFSYFLSEDTLVTGLQYKWYKIKNYQPQYLQKLIPVEDKISLTKIDTNFITIKIPRSDFQAKHIVDSLVESNKEALGKIPNLIIDIRNNTGGTWAVYKSLFPYIYTNPMVGGEQMRKCSNDFIEKQKEAVKLDKKDSTLYQFLSEDEATLDSMIKYRGSYQYLTPDTIQFDSAKVYPKKIIILTNYRCISASEMFIKFCQQSKKTIIAGEKTWGAIDNVGVIAFDSPSGNVKLYIPRAKNFYKKNLLLDFIGISPNINIPSTETDWYKFVITYLKNKN